MPGFNINNFASHINKTGTLNASKFLVNFTVPRGLTNTRTDSIQSSFTSSSRDINDLITFRAESVKVPGVKIDSSNIVRYGIGPAEKKPFNVSFNDTTISFIVDKNTDLYSLFYTWINYIFNYSGSLYNTTNQNNPNMASYTASYKNSYETDIEIVIYDESGEVPVQIFRLKKAFPISINDFNLSWSSKSTLIRLNVDFTFKEWSLDNVTSNFNVNVNRT